MADRQKEARLLLASALAHAMKEKRCSHEAAARSMGVTVRTVGSWVRGTGPIRVEVVLASPRLGAVFRDYLSGVLVDQVVAAELEKLRAGAGP